MRRLVILGASNISWSFRKLLFTARATWNEPLEILAAHGHGRSYGAWSRLLVRELPGITGCGLWQAVAKESSFPSHAILTDVGNDILYHFEVPMIATWVEQCLDQLAQANCQTVVLGLPVENLAGLSEARFHFYRALLMPRCRLSLQEASERAHDLNDRLRTMVLARNMQWVSPLRERYGLDPLHVRRKHSQQVWENVFKMWQDRQTAASKKGFKWIEPFSIRFRSPAHRKLIGREFHASQPCIVFRDGTQVSLY